MCVFPQIGVRSLEVDGQERPRTQNSAVTSRAALVLSASW